MFVTKVTCAIFTLMMFFLDVSWTIPFTAVATSVAAIITQFFLGHRYVLLCWPLWIPDEYHL